MYLHNTWSNETLLYSEGSAESEEDHTEHDDHPSKPALSFENLQWHVILGICVVSIGLLTVFVCVTWACIRKYCCTSVPKKIGRIKVIVRQPSIVSLGDDISNQRTWVTTTSMSNIEESHPSIFDVLPSLRNPKDSLDAPGKESKDHSSEQSTKTKKFDNFLNV